MPRNNKRTNFHRFLFLWLSLTGVSAFTPGQTPKVSQKKPTNGAHQQYKPKTKTSLPVAVPIPSKEIIKHVSGKWKGTEEEDNRKSNKRNGRKLKHKGQKNDNSEFAWLYWLYRQWHDSPVATVEKNILNQFLPAARCWKRKKSVLGAQRASELAERYALEFLAGNPHAVITSTSTIGKSTESYFVKLLRTGLWAREQGYWKDPINAQYELLDNLQNLAMRSEWEPSRSKILENQVQDHRFFVQEKSEDTIDDDARSNKKNYVQELSDLVERSMRLQNGDGCRIEESLVAMQQAVISLRQLLSNHKNKAEKVEDFEDLLLATSDLQKEFLNSSEWLSVAMPYFEFLHHSLIRELFCIGEPAAAQDAYWRMHDLLAESCMGGKSGNAFPSQTKGTLTPTAMMNGSIVNEMERANKAIQRIVAINDDGKQLIAFIKLDKEIQWLSWLYNTVQNTPVGELEESVLKSIIPAITMHSKRKSKKDAQRAEELLDRYVQEWESGNHHARLENGIFNRVCDAWAKLGEPLQAEKVLKRMAEIVKQQEQEDCTLQPDVYSMSTLAAAWANSQYTNAASKAEELLQYMEEYDLNPNTIMYNSVLKSLVKSPHLQKAMRAEEIVRRMEQRYESGHSECKPSIRTYQSLITAWSRTKMVGTAQKAEQILEYLDEKAKDQSDLDPNSHCFSAAIHAWAYSMEENKARRAYNILSHMRERYEKDGKEHCKPNCVAYTSVINACACPALESEHEEAFQIAQLAFDELLYNPQYGHPNFLTYASFLRVCATTMPPGPERDSVARSIFDKACEEGSVGHVVIEKIKNAASQELYQELILETGVEQADGSLVLPRSWTRHTGSEQPARKRQQNKKTTKRRSKHYRPEAARIQEVRILRGASGSYSKDKDEQPISFEHRPF